MIATPPLKGLPSSRSVNKMVAIKRINKEIKIMCHQKFSAPKKIAPRMVIKAPKSNVLRIRPESLGLKADTSRSSRSCARVAGDVVMASPHPNVGEAVGEKKEPQTDSERNRKDNAIGQNGWG